MADKGLVKFKYMGKNVVGEIDSKTRKWKLQDTDLDKELQKTVLALLQGYHIGEGPPPRSPADGVAWMADVREATKRVDGKAELPAPPKLDEDAIY